MTLRPQRSDSWLSPKEVAGRWGLKEDSTYRWIAEGTIPEKWVKYAGRRRIFIHPDAILYLETVFAKSHKDISR
jgi:hypothetical protein